MIKPEEAKLGLLVTPNQMIKQTYSDYADWIGELIEPYGSGFVITEMWIVYWVHQGQGPWYLTSLDKINKEK